MFLSRRYFGWLVRTAARQCGFAASLLVGLVCWRTPSTRRRLVYHVPPSLLNRRWPTGHQHRAHREPGTWAERGADLLERCSRRGGVCLEEAARSYGLGGLVREPLVFCGGAHRQDNSATTHRLSLVHRLLDKLRHLAALESRRNASSTLSAFGSLRRSMFRTHQRSVFPRDESASALLVSSALVFVATGRSVLGRMCAPASCVFCALSLMANSLVRLWSACGLRALCFRLFWCGA